MSEFLLFNFHKFKFLRLFHIFLYELKIPSHFTLLLLASSIVCVCVCRKMHVYVCVHTLTSTPHQQANTQTCTLILTLSLTKSLVLLYFFHEPKSEDFLDSGNKEMSGTMSCLANYTVAICSTVAHSELTKP